ncbi:MAG: hypothetical protein KCHDKBKB_01863 [Elusimicrobia bacterium]|nr:hypothetical protein [Elusimicrobiota bacterium]
MGPLSVLGGAMPIYPELFGIHEGGRESARPVGFVFWIEAIDSLRALGKRRLGPI